MKRKIKQAAVIPALLIAAGLSLPIYLRCGRNHPPDDVPEDIEYNAAVAAEKPDFSALWAEADEYNAFLRDKKTSSYLRKGSGTAVRLA